MHYIFKNITMSEKTNFPSQEWLQKFEKAKEILTPLMPYDELFAMKEIFGKKLFILEMGEVNFPTGKILARDPLCYLQPDAKPYFQQVPTGKFPLETLVIEIEEDHYRYMASRVKFSENKPVRYENAMAGNEKLEDIEEGDFFGFNVDAGLATIVDVQTRDAFCDFEKKWYEAQKNPQDSNIYNDFFSEEFAKSYQNRPEFQREGGDWINFTIPNTDLSVPMIQSGWGDGSYPVYIGYDENNAVCDVVIEFISPMDEDEEDDE